MVAVLPEGGGKLKSDPMPLSDTASGLVSESSVMVTPPVRNPAVVGEKLTWSVQFPPAGTGPQLLLWLKSPAIVM